MKRTTVIAASLAAFTSLAATSVAMAQSATALDRRPALVAQARPGQPLTAASNAAPHEIVASYLRGRGRTQSMLASLRTTDLDAGANGVRHLRLVQEIDGLEVHGTYVKAAINSRGELVHVVERLVAVSVPGASRINAQSALETAMARLHPGVTAAFRPAGAQGNSTSFDGGAFFHARPQVTAILLPLADGSLVRGWRVETWTARTNQLHYTIVDGEGRILEIESRTANDSYNMFRTDPGKESQTIVAGPGSGNAQSPLGWLGNGAQSTFLISGHNAKTAALQSLSRDSHLVCHEYAHDAPQVTTCTHYGVRSRRMPAQASWR